MIALTPRAAKGLAVSHGSKTIRCLFFSLLSPSPNILPRLICGNLIPFNLLSRNRQLASQTLKRILTQILKPSIQLFLISSLDLGNLLHDF